MNKIFNIKCSDWGIVASGKTAKSAAETGLKKMIKSRGSNLNLSFILSTEQISPKPLKDDISLFKTDEVLDRLGHKDWAAQLKEMRENLVKK